MPPLPSAKLPHRLRFVIFLLRVALGLDFFYLGWSSLFNASLVSELRAQSLGQLYRWTSTANAATVWPHPLSSWIFLLAGACLVVGFLTTFAAIVGIILVAIGYLPLVSLAAVTVTQFINDGLIVILCLFVILFSKAGKYLGLDAFMRFGRKKV